MYLQLSYLLSELLIHPYTTTHLFLNTEVCVNMLLTPSNCALTKCLRTNRVLGDCPRDYVHFEKYNFFRLRNELQRHYFPIRLCIQRVLLEHSERQ